MPRLSIDVTPEQHAQLKSSAALRGQSIKDFVLDRALVAGTATAERSDEEALAALKALLAPRLTQAEAGNFRESAAAETIAEAKRRKSVRSVTSRHSLRRICSISGPTHGADVAGSPG